MKDLSDQLKQATENLERLREEFKDEPELLSVYEPSAVYLVGILEKEVNRIDGKVCEVHKVGYISGCPSCAFEQTQEKDKHTYRKFQPQNKVR